MRLRKAVLEKNGYAVLSANNGKDAIQTLREAPVCLVISDHMLRGETGLDLAHTMKEIKPDVPVVLYSGNPPDSMRGVDCFINKSESTAQFLEIIADLIRRYCEVI